MKPIELELWRPRKDDPRYAERVGQRSAEEVFRELEQRLDSMGMLPDEYFLLDMDWQDGRCIPEGADIFIFPKNGMCIYKCGAERFLLEVHAPEHKKELFGDAGGR